MDVTKRKTIFIDFETIPNDDTIIPLQPPSVEDLKLGNIVDEEKKKKAIAEKMAKAMEDFEKENDKFHSKIIKERSLNPLENRIICAGIAVGFEKPFTILGTEEHIMKEVNKVYNKTRGHFESVAYNGKEFDFSMLALKAFKYDLTFLKGCFIDFSRFDAKWIDLAEFVKFFSHKYYSFDDICRFFNIPSPKDGMDGSKVYQAWKDGKINEISEYCKRDVGALQKLYKILKTS